MDESAIIGGHIRSKVKYHTEVSRRMWSIPDIRVCLEREHLRQTGLITALVGTWLTLFNQGNVLLAGAIEPVLLVKIALNYATPFVVANAGLLSRQTE